jgi:diguanylate cyclase (GGDEF)-like protein
MAVRLARPHGRQRGEDELLSCEICGAVDSATLCSPLVVSREVMGSVLLTRRRRFTDALTARLSEMLLIAAPAIANLRHLAIAEARAATDVLTGLPNRRSVDHEVKRMVARASRTGNTLAAAMLDIDHFKRVNDSYGQDRGDELLAAVADLMAVTLRGGDFVGLRGEEFVLLLPDTDRGGAAVVAEKLRKAIAELRLPGHQTSVTISIGVAALPDDAIDSEQLIRAADRALYLAKSLGRNRVELAANGIESGTPAHPGSRVSGICIGPLPRRSERRHPTRPSCSASGGGPPSRRKCREVAPR